MSAMAASRSALMLASLTFLALLAGFYLNTWQAADEMFFATNQHDTESLVIGRMARSAQRMALSDGGLLGFVGDGPPRITSDTVELWVSQNFGYQTDAYTRGAPIRSFSPYFSHSGLQGIGFSALDAVVPLLPSERKLRLFRALTAALVAAGYALLVLWLRRELGLGAALACLICLLVSPWLAAFSRNLYWSLWLFLLPPLAIGATLAAPVRHRNRWLAGVAFATLLARFLAGYEFITATAAMASAPVVYYAIRDRWPLRATVRSLGLIAGVGAAALIVSLAALTLQVAAVTGSARDAGRHLRFAVGRRTSGDPDRFPPAYAAGLSAKASNVVASYVADRADRGSDARRPAPLRWLNAWSYVEIIGLILLAVVWTAIRAQGRPAPNLIRARALAAAVLSCLAGILAWLVVFKAHSFNHHHVNPLMWHLLFLPLGASLAFWAAADAVLLLGRTLSRLPWFTRSERPEP